MRVSLFEEKWHHYKLRHYNRVMKDSSFCVEKKIEIARAHVEYVNRLLNSARCKLKQQRESGVRDEKQVMKLFANLDFLLTERQYVLSKVASLIDGAELQESERRRVVAGSRTYLVMHREVSGWVKDEM